MRKEFVRRLCDEIDSFKGTNYALEKVKTIYFGGGTPSLLKVEELRKIFKHLDSTFNLQTEEVTTELNPDDVSVEYLRDLKRLGINRASMGIQSFDPGRLKFMNRAHTRDEAVHSLQALNTAGFGVFTVDLIYGNPGQTINEVKKDIEQILEFEPPHISAYALTIEPGTRLGKQAELGRLTPADDEIVAEQFDLIGQKFDAKGIYRYEVSNYSKPGFEAVHNTSYWRHKNYLGFGPSAHSFWWDADHARRWKTVNSIKDYLNGSFENVYVEQEELPFKVLAEERLMLGLRTRWGVGADELKDKYRYELADQQRQWLCQKQEEDLLTFNGNRIILTGKGLKIADHLVVDFLLQSS